MISIYSSIYNNEPAEQDIETIINLIKSGPKCKPLIEKIRAEADKENRSELKKKLPLATFSGNFNGKREDKNLIAHSGFIVLDFDDIDNVEFLRAYLMKDKYVFAAFVSPSGNGMKVIIRIPKNNHRASFLALQQHFPEIDKSGKDICRACFLSYDKDLYYNPNAEVFEKQIEVVIESRKIEHPIEDMDRVFDILVSGFDKKADYFVEGNRNNYMFKLFSDCNNFGIPKDYAMQLAYSKILGGSDIKDSEVNTTANSAYKNTAGWNTRSFESAKKIDVTTIKNLPTTFIENDMPLIIKDLDGVKYVDVSADIIKPDYCITMEVDFQDYDLAFMGNMGVVTGPAKSMKSTLLKGLGSSVLMGGQKSLAFKTDFKDKAVLWFDTEQPEFRVLMGAKHMYRMADVDTKTPNPNFHIYSLRGIRDKIERLKRINTIISQTPNLGLVVIDGIVDLLLDYNSLTESQALVDWCLSVTDDREICMINVIHIANSTGKMRGHLGTELMNKCDFAIQTAKGDLGSEASCLASRDREFPSFHFFYGDDGLPYLDDGGIKAGNQFNNTVVEKETPKTFEEDRVVSNPATELKPNSYYAEYGPF